MERRLEILRAHQVYIGTSSWKYPGWQGWFYRRAYRNTKEFNENCLEEYAENLPAVGVDHTYYAWPQTKVFEKYRDQTPDGFRFCLKATERVTVYRFPRLPRYGKDAGLDNPEFLDSALFKERFLRPLDCVADRLGPILLEFSQFHAGTIASGGQFVERLGTFLNDLRDEKSFRFAVEIRNSNWLQAPYFEMLQKCGAGHVYSSWTKMPSLTEQLSLSQAYSPPYYCSRILLQPGTRYQEAVEAFSPYDKIVELQPQLRQDIASLITESVNGGVPAYVFVNNRAEGSSPQTITGVLDILEQRGLFSRLGG